MTAVKSATGRFTKKAALPPAKPRSKKTKVHSAPERGGDLKDRGTLKAIGGGDSNHWNARIGHRLVAALPGVRLDTAEDITRATFAGLQDINSSDPIEGMLAGQIIAAHEAALNLRQLAWLPEQHFIVQTKYLELAEKAARTMGMLTERLDQHRGRGQQQITVKHVTVNADQAMVADTITTDQASTSPPWSSSNLLTADTQKPMDTLINEIDVIRVGRGREKV